MFSPEMFLGTLWGGGVGELVLISKTKRSGGRGGGEIDSTGISMYNTENTTIVPLMKASF